MSVSDQSTFEKTVLLERIPGKGGWTYARIPEMAPDKKRPFGWRKVKGFIDGYEIKQINLMPLGNGQLFLPVKAEIRKKIKKEAGDYVKIILMPEEDVWISREDFILCLKEDEKAWGNFVAFPENEQQKYVNWIYAVKTEDALIQRMGAAINRIAQNLYCP